MSVLKDNRELLEDFVRGDLHALDRVYRAYVGSVARYLRTLTRTSDLGQTVGVPDLVQETFMRAFSDKARRQYDARKAYGPYLAAIARNCFIDALRSQGRWSATGSDSGDDPLERIGEPADPSADPWPPGALETVRSYLSELPAEMKSVYEQRFVLGRSQALAGTELGLTRAQLRTMERNLTIRLRVRLKKVGFALPRTKNNQEHPLVRNNQRVLKSL